MQTRYYYQWSKRGPHFLDNATLWNGGGNSQHNSLKVHPKLPTSTPIQPPLPWRPGRTPKVNLKEQEDHPAGAHNVEARIPLATYWNTNSSFKFAPWYDPDGSPFESRQSCLIRVKMVERVVLCGLGGWCRAEEGVNGRWTIWSADRRIWWYLLMHGCFLIFVNRAPSPQTLANCWACNWDNGGWSILAVLQLWMAGVFRYL